MRKTVALCQGYSLIELLVVLAIVAILSMVGVTMIGSRSSSSVRSVLDEVEGTIVGAQKTATTTSGDIYLSSGGAWNNGTLILDGRALNPTAVSNPPTATQVVAGVDAFRVGSSSECFRSRSPRDRDHISAGIDTGAGWYATACASAAPLAATVPISSQADFVTALGNPLFTGADKTVVVNGLTKRFMTGFCVVVVGLRDGGPVAGGAVGVLVVPQNSASVYKFYKPQDSNDWRRL